MPLSLPHFNTCEIWKMYFRAISPFYPSDSISLVIFFFFFFFLPFNLCNIHFSIPISEISPGEIPRFGKSGGKISIFSRFMIPFTKLTFTNSHLHQLRGETSKETFLLSSSIPAGLLRRTKLGIKISCHCENSWCPWIGRRWGQLPAWEERCWVDIKMQPPLWKQGWDGLEP